MAASPPIVAVTVDDLKQLQTLPPRFRGWVWYVYYNGTIDLIVQAVMTAGRAASVVEAINYLAEAAAPLEHGTIPVAMADIRQRRHRGHHYPTLRRLLTGHEGNGLDPELFHGIVSHQAIHALMTNQLPGLPPLTKPPVASAQLGLFDDEASETRAAVEALDLFPQLGPPEVCPAPAALGSRDRRVLERRIGRAWESTRAVELSKSISWMLWRHSSGQIHRLAADLERLYGHHARRILEHRHRRAEALQTLTFLSWAGAVREHVADQRTHVLFREVPVLAPSHQISGGRIDALEVRAINGQPPTSRQLRVLAAMTGYRYQSTGHLLRQLVHYFRAHLEVAVIDWKFLVGDILRGNGSNGAMPDVTGAPMADHAEQMRRYLTLIPLDLNLSLQSPRLWSLDEVSIVGDLTYILPQSLPVHHQIAMSPEERQQRFLEDVVEHWRSASRQAAWRTLSNAIVGHVVQLLQERPNDRRTPTVKAPRSAHPSLFAAEPARPTALDVIADHHAQHERFVDGTRIIEIVGRRSGLPTYELRYDRLLAAMANGAIPSPPGFIPERGGKIHCLMPNHQGDRTPSMHVYLTNTPPSFYCFGCESRGLIASESIPTDLDVPTAIEPTLRMPSAPGGALARHRYAVEPEEHHRFMVQVQACLAARFRGSHGERYLATVRGLSPDLAEQFGAGFGTTDVVVDLLASGRTLEELAFYGVVGYSAKVKPDRGLTALLLRRGSSLDELRRPISRTAASVEYGLPYFVMQDRLTFPLTLDGKHNNVYGRAVYPCERIFAHRKLAIKRTKVDQGGLNMDVLNAASVSEVIVAEGVMDVLSLVELGHRHVVGLIGVLNKAILGAIARSQKDLAIALDNDETGRDKTPQLVDKLRQLGYQGATRDFTAAFVAQHQEGPYKDYNEWWLRYGRQPQTF